MTASHDRHDEQRLEQLVIERCNGSLSAEGNAELQELLAKSDELRSMYWDIIGIHADLDWDYADEESLRTVVPGIAPTDSQTAALTPRIRRAEARSLWEWRWASAAAVAALLFGIFGLQYFFQLQPQEKQGEIALATEVQDAVSARLSAKLPGSHWSSGRPGEQNPAELLSGDTVWVEEGLVEMRLQDGTFGELSAPVVLQLLDSNRVRLLTGKIKVIAPNRPQGFAVETASAEVVDLGTVFSVEANEDGTDLVVYDGKVDLRTHGEERVEDELKPLESNLFITGQAVHVSKAGTLSRIMYVESSEQGLPDLLSRPPCITSVTDNIVRDDYWTFYEIVKQGMGEDVRAFVDRFHEWNGATTAGMPAYLRGGDYVRMYNDDKISKEYVVEVKVTQPAMLYVLLDERVAAPQWLLDSFEDSGDVIGIDETPHDPINRVAGNEQFSQIGPGESIDRTHTIWRTTLPLGGTVRLGPNGDPLSDEAWNKRLSGPRGYRANMYGIVVVPLEDLPE